MTEIEQRIAIAEELGWMEIERPKGSRLDGYAKIFGRKPPIIVGDLKKELVPQYLRSLDDCHEFLRLLEPNDQVFYVACLFEVLNIHTPEFEKEARANDFYFRCLTASAAELCKAFLKLKGKWKE